MLSFAAGVLVFVNEVMQINEPLKNEMQVLDNDNSRCLSEYKSAPFGLCFQTEKGEF